MKTKASLVLVVSFCLICAAYLFAGDTLSSASNLPGTRMLSSISEKYNPVKFDHQKHVALAGNCAACHHHPKEASSCKECHGVTPASFKGSVVNSFIACSNCHSSADRDNPAMPGLKVAYHKKCFECHRGMGDIGSDPKGCTEICHAKKSKTASVRK